MRGSFHAPSGVVVLIILEHGVQVNTRKEVAAHALERGVQLWDRDASEGSAGELAVCEEKRWRQDMCDWRSLGELSESQELKGHFLCISHFKHNE